MQSKTTRGVRRLLVSTGVISLVLSVAAPAALAEKPEGTPGNGPEVQIDPTGLIGSDADNVEICHHNNGNGGVVINPNENSINRGKAHGSDHRGDELDTEACPDEEQPDSTTPEGEGEGESTDNGDGGGTDGGDTNDDGNQDGNAGGNSDGTPGDGNENNPTGQDGSDNGGDDVAVEGDSTEVTEQPEQESEPAKPVVIISADTVTKPVVPAVPAQPAVTNTPAPAAPASPSAAPSVNPNRTPEVLGSVTTRTPGGTQVTALAATGSTTTLLAIVGATLLLAGLGMQTLGRRQAGSVLGA